MGNKSSTIKEDKVTLKYRRHRSRPLYVANIVHNGKVIKKQFRAREDAYKWKDYIRQQINEGQGEIISMMANTYT